MKKYICEYCKCEHDGLYGSGRFCSDHCRRVWSGKHTAHNGNHKCNWPKPKKSKFGTWKCKFCGIIFETKKQLWEHLHKEHGNLLYGPHGAGKSAWNKGLTKETDPRMKVLAIKTKEGLQLAIKNGKSIGRASTPEKENLRRKRLSEAALKSTHQRICKKTLPYTCIDGTIVNLDSSYERKVAQILDENQIKWIRPIPLKWVSADKKEHNYFPDFYLVDFDLYLDPKNEYCFKVQAEKIKYISEHYSNVIFLHEQNLTKDFIMSLCHKGCGADF